LRRGFCFEDGLHDEFHGIVELLPFIIIGYTG